MEWEDLLHSLWDLLVERGSAELEKRIRDLLKERATDEWLHSVGQILGDGQLDQAKNLVNDFLRDHPDLPGVTKKLELILLFERRKSARSPARKARNREQLLQTVNSLVSSGKQVAAEELLVEALAEGEDPELLDLLGRVYMLQRRPQQAAGVMQRALLARRQQAVFVEPVPHVNHVTEADDDTVSDADLDYFAADASVLAGMDAKPVWHDAVGEPGKPQLDQSDTVVPDSEAALGQDCETIVPPVPAATTEELHTPVVEVRKTLSLNRPRKSGEATVTPDGVKVLVKHVTSSTAELVQMTPASIAGAPHDIAPTHELPIEDPVAVSCAQPPLDPERFHSESDIHEGIISTEPDGRDASLSPVEDPSEDLDDDYESDDIYLYDSDALLVEPVEIDEVLTDEPTALSGGIEDEYAAYAFDPDDIYDTLDSAADDTDQSDEKLSRDDRALQKAAELITKTGWPSSALPLIQQIFVMSGWGTTRMALEREIEKGMTPEELILAAHVKVVWNENDIYWIAYDKTGSSNLSQYVISWPAALLLVRAFDSLPQIEELEQFIEKLFEYWHERPHLRSAFRSFNRFLWFRVANLEGCLPANQPFNYGSPYELPAEEYSDLGLTDLLGSEIATSLHAFGVPRSRHKDGPRRYVRDQPSSPETDATFDV